MAYGKKFIYYIGATLQVISWIPFLYGFFCLCCTLTALMAGGGDGTYTQGAFINDMLPSLTIGALGAVGLLVARELMSQGER